MALNRDDIIGEVNVNGSSGITCKSAHVTIDPITRNLKFEFSLVKITVLADNRYFEEPLSPLSVDLTDGTGTKFFNVYNRRNATPTPGKTNSYDALSKDIISLYFDTAAKNGLL